jgi:hypothetical protein
VSSTLPKYKCGYRLCTKSVRGMKPKRKFCTPQHAQKEQYLAKHPEARGNQLVETKPVKQGRPAIKKRICEYPTCRVDISDRTPSKRFCADSKHNAVRARALTKKLNFKKRMNFEKSHGIVRNKQVFNRDAHVSPMSRGVEFTDQALIYENYKEPLKPIEKGKGYGYYGTIAITDDKQYVQCHICGNLYPNVGMHLRKHKIKAADYKERFGLRAMAALMSEPERERHQRAVVGGNHPVVGKGELPTWLQEYNAKVQRGEIIHPGTKRKEGGMSLQKRNEIGKCPDQVLEKIRELADKLGRAPSYEEFRDHYKYEYLGSIKFQHGSFSAAVHKLGLKTAAEIKSPDSDLLLQRLIDFHDEHGRIPTKSDFERGLVGYPRSMYWRRFGSLNNARVEAGLNAILPMPFGQQLEMTPEAYLEYKAGHNSPLSNSRSAVNKRKRLARRRAEKGGVPM